MLLKSLKHKNAIFSHWYKTNDLLYRVVRIISKREIIIKFKRSGREYKYPRPTFTGSSLVYGTDLEHKAVERYLGD